MIFTFLQLKSKDLDLKMEILLLDLLEQRGNPRNFLLIFVSTVNDDSPGFAINRKEFENLTPIYPNERILLENGSKNLTCRIVDLISPIGKGQRGLIVSKPKVGKTTLIKNIANAVCKAYKDIQIFILLIDERPEEVTDMEREVVGDNVEVIASTFDQLPSNHTKVSEMVLDRAKD